MRSGSSYICKPVIAGYIHKYTEGGRRSCCMRKYLDHPSSNGSIDHIWELYVKCMFMDWGHTIHVYVSGVYCVSTNTSLPTVEGCQQEIVLYMCMSEGVVFYVSTNAS